MNAVSGKVIILFSKNYMVQLTNMSESYKIGTLLSLVLNKSKKSRELNAKEHPFRTVFLANSKETLLLLNRSSVSYNLSCQSRFERECPSYKVLSAMNCALCELGVYSSPLSLRRYYTIEGRIWSPKSLSATESKFS